MSPRRSKLSPLLWLAVAATGCGSGGSLKVTKISAAADQPANVAVYLDVKDKLGRPIPNLQEKNFRVYEDGKLRYAGKVGAGFNDASTLITGLVAINVPCPTNKRNSYAPTVSGIVTVHVRVVTPAPT